MTLSRSSVLFYNDFASGPEPEVGGPLSFGRDSEKWTLGRDGLYHRARAGQWAYEWWDLSGKVSQPPSRRPLFDINLAVTPLNDDSADFSASSAWIFPGGSWTRTAVRSVFGPSYSAWQVTNTDASPRGPYQAFTATGGVVVVASTVFETVGGTGDSAYEFRLFNQDTLSSIVEASFDQTTGTAVISGGSGTLNLRKLSDAGPNGGALYRISIVASVGSGTTFRTQFALLETNGSVILHHSQAYEYWQETSPIVYAGSPVTRTQDVVGAAGPPPQSMVGYAALVARGASSDADKSRRIIAHGSFDNPRLHVFLNNAHLGVFLVDGGGASNSANAANDDWTPGAYVEVFYLYDHATGGLYIGTRADGGAVTSVGPNVPGTFTAPTFWNGGSELDNTIGWGGDGDLSGSELGLSMERHYCVNPDDLDAAIDGTAGGALMDELAGFHMRGP